MILFWGFEDLNFVLEVAKKARQTLNIKDYCVQIHDLEKTSALLELAPEEIIRTKQDLHNLYLWLKRSAKKDMFVFVNVFSLILQNDFEENRKELKNLLTLPCQFMFFGPKILNPQADWFLNNTQLQQIFVATKEYTNKIKACYEVVLNAGVRNAHIILSPVPECVVLNRVFYDLFAPKLMYQLTFYPKILKFFRVSFITRHQVSLELVNIVKSLLNGEPCNLFCEIAHNKEINFLPKTMQFLFKPLFFISESRFFKFKNPIPRLNQTQERYNLSITYIQWLYYLSICENV